MKKERKLTPALSALAVLLIYIFNSAVFSPFLSYLTDSFELSSQVIEILYYFSGILPMIASFITYAFLIRSIIKSSVKSSLVYVVLYQAACFLGLVFSVVLDYIKAGKMPASSEISRSLLSVLSNFLLLSVLIYAVLFFTFLIKKKAKPEKIVSRSALLAAGIEGIKQLAVELGYIIPFLVEHASDIRPGEILSIVISLVFVLFVFGLGYVLIHGILKKT